MPLKEVTKFRTEGINVTATSAGASAQLLYICPPNFSALVTFLHISSGNSANKKISVQFYHEETATYRYLLREYVMVANDSYNIVTSSSLSLHQNDKIVCFTDTTTNFDVFISIEEYFDPVR
jgi:hypothetical protein